MEALTMSKKFVRLSEGLNHYKLVPESEVDSQINDVDKDYYTSIFLYNQTHYDTWKSTKSIAGIKDVVTNRLVFDFDKEGDIPAAKKDAETLITRLADDGFNTSNIQVAFSGNKGFSVEVQLDKTLLSPIQFRNMVFAYAGDLPTFDTVVNDPNRIFRVTGTRHPKSKLYKFPILAENFNKLSVPDILTLAKDIDNASSTDFSNWVPVNLPTKAVAKMKSEPKIESVKELVALPNLSDIKHSKPKHWKLYKWAIVNAIAIKPGERNICMMIIAATCKGYSYNREITKGFLTQFDEKYAAATKQKTNPEEIHIVLDSVFKETWQGGQYNIENNIWLQDYTKRIGYKDKEDEREKIISVAEIEQGFTNYVKNLEANTITVGIPAIDRAIPITTGMNLAIVGAPSSGKTALALEILKNTSQKGVVSVFVSLDMHRNRLFTKLLMKVTGYDLATIHRKFKSGDTKDVMDKLKQEYGNVWFYDRSAATVDKIYEYLDEVEELTGQKVKLVMVDYFERVNSDKSDETAASKDVAGRLQDLIADRDIAMITLVQPNKMSISGGADQPILHYSAIKGSSFLSQSFRSIISIWRPFFNPEWAAHDKFMQMAILKNDLGELDVLHFTWNGRRGEIKECTDEQREEMEELIEKKKVADAVKKQGTGFL